MRPYTAAFVASILTGAAAVPAPAEDVATTSCTTIVTTITSVLSAQWGKLRCHRYRPAANPAVTTPPRMPERCYR